MAQYRNNLPQLQDEFFLTDGGLETTLVFHHGLELPYFASFDLLAQPQSHQLLLDYYDHYLQIARQYNLNFVLESGTWRASSDWGDKLGYSANDLKEMNTRWIMELEMLRQRHVQPGTKIVISGCLGPRGDGYKVEAAMSAREAEEYHRPQIQTFSQTNADLVTAFTLNYSDEAVGIVRAAKAMDMPVVISFTLETDGRLPNQESLPEAIARVDALTDQYPAYYMINCAHPLHFMHVLAQGGSWLNRIRGIRANASTKSHAELDESTNLDPGDKHLLASTYQELKNRLPNLNVVGGCCGTDHTHLQVICQSLFAGEEATAAASPSA